MNLFVPNGYKLVAKTEISGTCTKCYYNPECQKVFFIVEYLNFEYEAQQKWLSFGPVPKATLECFAITLKDVIEMNTPMFIEDK